MDQTEQNKIWREEKELTRILFVVGFTCCYTMGEDKGRASMVQVMLLDSVHHYASAKDNCN